MTITWLGESCFKIQAKGDNGKDVVIVIDPFDAKHAESVLPRSLSADLLLVTDASPLHGYRQGVSGSPFIIDGPGEYETHGVLVYGIPLSQDQHITLYYGQIEGMSFVHCGGMKTKLTEKHLEMIEDAHIVFLPVGGGDVLGADAAADVVNQIEPRVVIPMAYAKKNEKGRETVDLFLRAMGVKEHEVLPQFKIAEKDLPQDEVRVVVLES